MLTLFESECKLGFYRYVSSNISSSSRLSSFTNRPISVFSQVSGQSQRPVHTSLHFEHLHLLVRHSLLQPHFTKCRTDLGAIGSAEVIGHSFRDFPSTRNWIWKEAYAFITKIPRFCLAIYSQYSLFERSCRWRQAFRFIVTSFEQIPSCIAFRAVKHSYHFF